MARATRLGSYRYVCACVVVGALLAVGCRSDPSRDGTPAAEGASIHRSSDGAQKAAGPHGILGAPSKPNDDDNASYGLAAPSSTATRASITDPAAHFTSANPEIGAWDPAWVAEDVALDPSGRYAYVAGGNDGFSIVDLRDPSRPLEIASLDDVQGSQWARRSASDKPALRREFRRISLDEHHVFLSSASTIVWIDVSVPAQPRFVSFWEVGSPFGAPPDITAGNGFLHVAEGPTGPTMLPLDRATPFHLSAELPVSGWTDAAASAGRLVAAGPGGFEIIDVSDPERPQLVGLHEATWDVHRVAVDEDRAYFLTEGRAGAARRSLHVFDVSNPAQPAEIAEREPSLKIDDFLNPVAIDAHAGHVAVVSQYQGGHILEILDGAHIDGDQAGSVRLDGQGAPGEPNVQLGDRFVIVSLLEQGLRVVDVDSLGEPRVVGSVETVAGVYDMAVDGHFVYAACFDHGLRIVDAHDATGPEELAAFDPAGYVRGVAVGGGIAWVAADALHVLDVSDPGRPRPIARWEPAAPPTSRSEEFVLDVWIDGDLAYVSSSRTPLVVLDVSEPAAPRKLGQTSTESYGGLLHPHGDRMYLAAGPAGLHVVDIRRPAEPVVMGTYRPASWVYDAEHPNDVRGAEDVWAAGDLAYVAAARDGLHVVDVSDPSHPRQLMRSEAAQIHNRHDASVMAVMGTGQQLVVANGYGFLNVLDRSKLGSAADHPAQLNAWWRRWIENEGANRRFAVNGGRLYVAASLAGLRIVDLPAIVDTAPR